MERIVKTIAGKSGRLYVESDGNRCLAARCQPKIQLVEELADIPALGRGHVIKKRTLTMLLTFDREIYSPVPVENVTGFALRGDFLQSNGQYIQLDFAHCLLVSDLDLTEAGTCTFEAACSPELMKRLRSM